MVSARAEDVWARVTAPEGINFEMWPWMSMRMPRRVAGMTIETLPVGVPIGRAWLRLFGVVPFEFDHLTISEVEPGRRFLESSTMLSVRRWEHQRTLTSTAETTQVCDRIRLQPRMPLLGAFFSVVVDAFFAHRQRRLQRYFASR